MPILNRMGQPMSLGDMQRKFTLMVAHLITFAYQSGYEITLGEAWRPEWVAAEYERQGIGKKNTFHTRRLAIDLNLFKDRVWLQQTEDHRVLGEYWESLGGTWGGRFRKPDGNHYSLGE